MSLLGLDMGTSACKAAIFSEDGVLLASSSREYSADVPRPGWMEMDPDRMWNAAVEAVREASDGLTDSVSALAVSSQGETFVPVDRDGRSVASAVMNADNRAADQVSFFEQELGIAAVYSATGCVLHSMYALPKILWLKDNRPELYNSTAKFLSVGDYMLARLGAEPLTDYSLASRTMAFDVTRREWSDALLSSAGVGRDRLPQACPAGTRAGVLSASDAGVFGLSEGTVVAVGGHDQPCGALGAGVVNPGDTADSAGSYECLAMASDRPTLSDEALAYSLNSYCHVVPEKYVTLAFFPAGVVLRWFRDQFALPELEEARRTGADAYDLLASRIPDDPSGVCFTPHFIGSGNPTWNASATGAVVGLRLDTTRFRLFQAILEGIACEIRTNVGVLERLIGPIDVLRTTGGGARSDYWLRLRSDITGKKVATMRGSEAVCLGAAILAGVAAGVYADAQDGARAVAAFDKVYEPDASRAIEYSEQIARYDKLYPALAGSEVFE